MFGCHETFKIRPDLVAFISMYEGRLSPDFLIIFIPCLFYVLSWSVLTRHTDLLKTEKKIWSPILQQLFFPLSKILYLGFTKN